MLRLSGQSCSLSLAVVAFVLRLVWTERWDAVSDLWDPLTAVNSQPRKHLSCKDRQPHSYSADSALYHLQPLSTLTTNEPQDLDHIPHIRIIPRSYLDHVNPLKGRLVLEVQTYIPNSHRHSLHVGASHLGCC